MKVKRLSPRQFDRALRLGHGRALLHVREYGDVGLEEIIECGLNDSNVSDSYNLINIVYSTGNLKRYAKCLTGTTVEELSEYELRHRMRVAAAFYRVGFDRFREQVIASFGRLVRISDSGLYEEDIKSLLEVASFGGLELIATSYGINLEPMSDSDCLYAVEIAEQMLGDYETNRWLETRARADKRVLSFRDAVERRKQFKHPTFDPEPPHTFDEFYSSVKLRKMRTMREYERFSNVVTPKELNEIFELTMKTKDEWEQAAYLRIFTYCPLPRINAKILELVESSAPYVSLLASRAIAKVASPHTRRLAKTALETNVLRGLRMLEFTYKSEDALLLLSALRTLTGYDDVHSANQLIRNMMKQSKDKSLVPCLLWLYEHESCGLCRNHLIEFLIEVDCLPARLALECQWDENDDVRKLVRERAVVGAEESRERMKEGEACPSPKPEAT